MLRNHGWRTNIFAAIRSRSASTAVKRTRETAPAKKSTKVTSTRKSRSSVTQSGNNVANAGGLAAMQAALESSGYDWKKAVHNQTGTAASLTKSEEPEKKGDVKAAEGAEGTKKGIRSTGKKTVKSERKTGQKDELEAVHKDAKKSARRLRRLTRQVGSRALPPRVLIIDEPKHHDLDSFLEYADLVKLKHSSTVYRGTHYEYTVKASLENLGFNVERRGGSNDRGIDLIGTWTLPKQDSAGKDRLELPVILQCKVSKVTPSMIRELEGAFSGAPSGWNEASTLAILVSTQVTTTGVIAALQRSQLPLGVMQTTRDGRLQQFVWNAAAAGIGLEGLGVTPKYSALKWSGDVADDHDSDMESTAHFIGLTWMGRPWQPVKAAAGGEEPTQLTAVTSQSEGHQMPAMGLHESPNATLRH